MKRTTALALLGLACLMAMPSIAHARYRDGMNLYGYVAASPVTHADPTGRAKLSIEIAPGWYDVRIPGAHGQARFCVRFEQGKCECNEETQKWHIKDVTLRVKLLITLDSNDHLDPDDDEETWPLIYGHEQRHVRMLKRALNMRRREALAALQKVEDLAYSTEGACQNDRKRKQHEKLEDFYKGVRKIAYKVPRKRRGFMHARTKWSLA